MKSIIQISDDIITIGDTSNNTLLEVRLSDCNFEPNIGDQVNIFSNEKKTLVSKVIPEPVKNVVPSTPEGININIVNDNSNKNEVPFSNIEGGSNVVNKTTYLLLTFFLGGLGAHKFYSGKTGLGILYLVFCWTYIPSLIALIEFIIACFKTADRQGRILV